MPANDAEAVRRVRAEIGRRYVDSSMVEVRVVGGIVHLTGILRPLRGHPDVDLKLEMDHIADILRQRPGIREVLWEVSVRA